MDNSQTVIADLNFDRNDPSKYYHAIYAIQKANFSSDDESNEKSIAYCKAGCIEPIIAALGKFFDLRNEILESKKTGNETENDKALWANLNFFTLTTSDVVDKLCFRKFKIKTFQNIDLQVNKLIPILFNHVVNGFNCPSLVSALAHLGKYVSQDNFNFESLREQVQIARNKPNLNPDAKDLFRGYSPFKDY